MENENGSVDWERPISISSLFRDGKQQMRKRKHSFVHGDVMPRFDLCFFFYWTLSVGKCLIANDDKFCSFLVQRWNGLLHKRKLINNVKIDRNRASCSSHCYSSKCMRASALFASSTNDHNHFNWRKESNDLQKRWNKRFSVCLGCTCSHFYFISSHNLCLHRCTLHHINSHGCVVDRNVLPAGCVCRKAVRLRSHSIRSYVVFDVAVALCGRERSVSNGISTDTNVCCERGRAMWTIK